MASRGTLPVVGETARWKGPQNDEDSNILNASRCFPSYSTQDLFSDPTADSAAELLLERDTHLFLKIQLDADNGKINVNDASLDIAGDDKTALITVAGIKAEVGFSFNSLVFDIYTWW